MAGYLVGEGTDGLQLRRLPKNVLNKISQPTTPQRALK